MKIQLASDLHLELLGAIWGAGAFIEPAPEADVTEAVDPSGILDQVDQR